MRDCWQVHCWSLECRSIWALSDISSPSFRERSSSVLVPWDCNYFLVTPPKEHRGSPGRLLKRMHPRSMDTFFASVEQMAARYMFLDRPKTPVSILLVF